MRSYKPHYRRFLSAVPERLHFAAHSHHLWPDVTRDAVIQCWDDAAQAVDGKWGTFIQAQVEQAQKNLAQVLNLSDPGQIALAPNTHELIYRLVSCFPSDRPTRVVTTNSEFYSFRRQLSRLCEVERAIAFAVDAMPIDSFADRFTAAIQQHNPDLVYVSQIFFDSGLSCGPLEPIVEAAKQVDAVIVVDGYHSFCALPVDLSRWENDIFFTSGGYKYAQSGEGICFLSIPENFDMDPVNTGWYAGFSSLADTYSDRTHFEKDARRFAGATYDPTGIYRWNAVMKWFEREEITIDVVHQHVRQLQTEFLHQLEEANLKHLPPASIVYDPSREHGHFFTFALASEDDAQWLFDKLHDEQVVIDRRGNRVRFGFGLYQDRADVQELFRRMSSC